MEKKPVSRNKRASLSMAAAMAIFGTIGIFRRYIPLPSGVIACVRGAIGAAFLLCLLALRREGFCWAGVRAQWKRILLSGVLLGCNWMLLFEAYEYTSVSTATLCYYMAPVILILISPLVFEERLSCGKLLCALAAVAGMTLVSGIWNAGAIGADGLRGILFGLGAAALYAGVVVLNKKIRRIPGYERTILQLATAAAAMLPYALLSQRANAAALTPQALGMLALVGVVHTGLAYALYFGSMEKLAAQSIALMAYLDPIVAILLSALLLHEPMGVAQAAGAVLVLGAALGNELLSARGPAAKGRNGEPPHA